MLSAPTHTLFACSTQWKCIGGLTPPTHPRCVRTKWKAPSGFEKKLNKVIYDTLNGHKQFDIYKMITDFGHMLEYYLLDMILRYKDKYTLYDGYHGVIS